MNNDSMRIELPDFQEFMKEVVECVSLGYTKLHLTSDDYPDTFGGFMYSCTLSRPESVKVSEPVRQTTEVAQSANPQATTRQRGRPKGSGTNPRYDRGLKFNTNPNS